jgi:hypothetical protein
LQQHKLQPSLLQDSSTCVVAAAPLLLFLKVLLCRHLAAAEHGAQQLWCCAGNQR